MHILLINKNPIVSKLMELATKSTEIALDETKETSAIEQADGYDIVFVDDGCCKLEDIERYFGVSGHQVPVIFIANKITLATLKDGLEGITHILKKPFLPSHLVALMHNIEAKKQNAQSVLDPDDIATIKELLQTQASQLSTEKTLTKEDLSMIDFVFEQSTPSKEDELLKAIKKMKPKKIKKLLEDATVTLTIQFPKES